MVNYLFWYSSYKLKQIQDVKKIVFIIIINPFKHGYFINTSVDGDFIIPALKISDT